MKRSPLSRKTPMPRATAPMRKRKAGKARIESTGLREFARGQDCTLQLPGCPNATDTTVLCHLRMFGGGGMGIKPHDSEAIFADHYCHDLLDGRTRLAPEVRGAINFYEYIARALIRTIRAQREALGQ